MILGEPIQTMTMRRRTTTIASQIHPSLNATNWNGIQIHLPTFLERLPGLVREDRRRRKAQPSFWMFSLSLSYFFHN